MFFFLFVSAVISLLIMILAISILCKHTKLKTLVASPALQQIKEVDAVATQETLQYIECTCKIQWYTILMLGILILGLLIFIFINSRKLKLFRGHLFSHAVKIMLFISNTKHYVPIQLCKTAGSIHLFKITGTLTSENVKLKQNRIWDIIEIDWTEVSVTLNGLLGLLWLPTVLQRRYKDIPDTLPEKWLVVLCPTVTSCMDSSIVIYWKTQ